MPTSSLTSGSSSSKSKTYLWLAAVMAVIGLFVHGYLYSHQLSMESGEFSKSVCDINALFNCSAVAASKYSKLFGVPVALWGLIANSIFLILLGVVLPLTDFENKPTARRNVMITAVAIVVASVVMGSISMFLISTLCAFCITAYVLSILMMVFAWLGFKNDEQPRRELTTTSSAKSFAPLVALTAVGFLAGFIIHSAMNPNADAASAAVGAYVNEWQGAAAREISLVDALETGATVEKAKMTIVEFADFRCIHCKHAAPIIHAFVAAHPDVRLEFQPWPLDGECNTSLNQSNGASCLLSRAVWCAQKKKQQGWAAHDYLYGLDEVYSNVEAVRTALPQIAAASQMSADEMKACADSDEAKEATRKQAEVGTALNLQGTPTIFVNRKQLSGGQSLPVLQRTYDSL